MESDDIEEFLPAGFLTPKGERCAFSVPPARPGIDVLSHVGMQVHVRPGIQVQAASEEPPPVKKSFSAQVRATARARSALYKLVFHRKTISTPKSEIPSPKSVVSHKCGPEASDIIGLFRI